MLDNFRERIIKAFTKTILYRLYIRWIWSPKVGSIDNVLHRAAKKNPDFTFVQIGANDGFHNDPLYRFVKSYRWGGILVEPQVHVFERLKKTYKGHSYLMFENAAIAPEKGQIPFYMLAVSDARWATGMSSFNKDHIEEHIEKGFVEKWAKREGVELPEDRKDFVKCVDVQTIDFDELINKHGVKEIDGVILDCEGYDSVVLSTIDIEKYNPTLILFEHLHFTDEDYLSLTAKLEKLGYQLLKDDMDTLAYKDL